LDIAQKDLRGKLAAHASTLSRARAAQSLEHALDTKLLQQGIASISKRNNSRNY